MAISQKSKNRRTKTRRRSVPRYRFIGKPAGRIQERVQQANPRHFGIVSVDCAKRRSRWTLTDFYGKVGYTGKALLARERTRENRRTSVLVV